jgi:hypothetical protein
MTSASGDDHHHWITLRLPDVKYPQPNATKDVPDRDRTDDLFHATKWPIAGVAESTVTQRPSCARDLERRARRDLAVLAICTTAPLSYYSDCGNFLS